MQRTFVLLILLTASCLHAQTTFFGDRNQPGATPPKIAGGDDLRKFLIGTTWSWEPDGKSRSEVTFFADGTVHHNAFLAKFMVRSRYDVELQLGDKRIAKWRLDSSFSSYTGTDFGGMVRLHGERVIKTPPPAAPESSAGATAAAATTRIAELMNRKSAIVESLFAPLDKALGAGVRESMVDLRENLLDESQKSPAASTAAYTLAVRYCNGLISAYDEREKSAGRMGGDTSASAVSANISRWKTRGAELRLSLDALWTEFRAAARQPVQPSPGR